LSAAAGDVPGKDRNSTRQVPPLFRRRTAMRIAYLSTDEVNRDLADRWAEQRNISLELLDGEPIPTDVPLDAVLCDLDHLPVRRPQEALAALLSATTCLAALHGYNLDEEQTRELHDRGILVVERLTESFLDRLCRAVRALTWTDPVHSDAAEEHAS